MVIGKDTLITDYQFTDYFRLTKKKQDMNFPAIIKYSKEHEWILVEGSNGTIGISDFAQKELGDIVYVDINTVGETVAKDGMFGTVEAVKTVSDLFMPVSGKILEQNTSINDSPDAVNKDPYGTGWLAKIEITNAAELNELMDAEAYKKHVGQ